MRYGNNWNEFWNNFYSYMDPETLAFLQSLFGVIVTIIAVGLACNIVFYILRSIGLMRIAQNRGMAYPWLGWIPALGTFMIGAVADDIGEKQNGSKTYFRWFLLGGMILSNATAAVYLIMLFSAGSSVISSRGASLPNTMFTFASLVNLLQYPLAIATIVLMLISLNKIYKCYAPSSSTAYTVLCFFFSFLIPIFLFALRNREPVPPGWPPAPGYYPPSQGYPPPGYPPVDYRQQPYNPGYPQPPYYQGYPPQQNYPPPQANPPTYEGSGQPPENEENRPPQQ